MKNGKITVNSKIIDLLNEALKNEFVSIKQWRLDGFNLKYQGLGKISKLFLEYAADEMEHQELIANRIFMIGGRPAFVENEKLYLSDDIKEIFQYQLKLENEGIDLLKKIINFTQDELDFVTSDMLTNILTDEEEHKLFLETQLKLIEKLTLSQYLTTMISDISA